MSNVYQKSVAHLDYIDIYRVLDLYQVNDSPLEHAIKKLLCAGQRGAKHKAQDVGEAIDALLRWKEMQDEDLTRVPNLDGIEVTEGLYPEENRVRV